MAEEAKAKGTAAFSAGRFEDAIRFFSEAIILVPSNHALYSNRSAAYASLHKFPDALSDAQKAVELKPDWSKGYSRLGAAHVGLNNLEDAISAYRKGLEFDPSNEALKSSLADAQAQKENEAGNAAFEKKDFELAVQHYTRAVELNDKDTSYLTNRAVVYMDMGKYEDCIKDCDKAVERGRELGSDFKVISRALTKKGTAYLKLAKCSKDYELAFEAFQQALTEHHNPDTLKKLNDAEIAKQDLEQRQYFDPKTVDAENGKNLHEMDDGPREMDEGNKSMDACNGRNLEPYIGMEFESDEAARKFYNDYSKRVGFSVRINSSYRSKKDDSIIGKTFVCSKEGYSPNKDSGNEEVQNPRQRMREGCKAMFSIKKQQSGKWFISKFEKNHSHPLRGPGEVSCPRLRRRMSGTNVGFSENYWGNSVGKGRLNTYGIDAQLILDYFKSMQAINPAFFYAIEVDQAGCLSNVFWVDARSRNAYGKFGDVVTFDMTYKKDQYLMPFAPFTGINHHQQSVLFGSALLSDGTESTFVWLFQTWLKAMSGRHPKAIITDQDKALKAAIAKVFPQTAHRYCKWWILKKVPEKLSLVYHEHKDFDLVFHNCVNNSETIDEFESSWASILDEYNLKHNDWLQSLYDDRASWVPVYLRGTSFAGMSTTEQSESVNSLFQGYVDSKTTLKEFVKQYELALENRYEKEVIEDFYTFYSKPFLCTPMSIEEQAASFYTRNVFKKFQEQLVESLLFAVNNSEDEAPTVIYRVSKSDEIKLYTVTFNYFDMKASCSCMMWEFEGILCKHILAVFRAKNIYTLPSDYILNRWRKDAKRDVCNIEVQADIQENMTSRFNCLCQEALKYAEEGASYVRVFREAMGIMREAMEKLTIARKKIEIGVPESQNNDRKNMARGSQTDSTANQAATRDPKYKKTKGHPQASSRETIIEKKRKTCGYCNVDGHDTHTCEALIDSRRNLTMGQSSNAPGEYIQVNPSTVQSAYATSEYFSRINPGALQKHPNPGTFFNANERDPQDGPAIEHSDLRGIFYFSQGGCQQAPFTGQLEPRNFFDASRSSSQDGPITVHSDPRAIFYPTPCGSQYGPVTGPYEHGNSDQR